jgi:sporulation protein YlmC with PRC-barrel domain
MANYRMQGQELVTSNGGERVGSFNGMEVFDRHNERVGSIRDNQIWDTHGEKAAEVQGEDIYDSRYQKIGTLSQARNAIDGATGGVSVAALWYFFIR